VSFREWLTASNLSIRSVRRSYRSSAAWLTDIALMQCRTARTIRLRISATGAAPKKICEQIVNPASAHI